MKPLPTAKQPPKRMHKSEAHAGQPPSQVAVPHNVKHDPQTSRQQIRFRLLTVILTPLILLSITLAVVIGPVEIAPLTVWQIAIAKVTGMTGEWSNAQVNIVWLIRFPRVLFGGNCWRRPGSDWRGHAGGHP